MKQTFVAPDSKEKRIRLLDFLEKEGFYYWPDHHNRQEMAVSPFPLVICLEEKWMGHMGNVTCAAASVKFHISVEEFYELYENAKVID